MSKVSFLRTTESKIVFYNFRYLNLLSNIPAEMPCWLPSTLRARVALRSHHPIFCPLTDVLVRPSVCGLGLELSRASSWVNICRGITMEDLLFGEVNIQGV